MKTGYVRAAVVLLTASLVACGGGGGGGSPSVPTPAGNAGIEILPGSFDFGRVTAGNVPAPLEVTVRNTGDVALSLSSIALVGQTGQPFAVDLNAGARPCGVLTAYVGVGQTCTFRVAFQPSGSGSYSSVVRIASNDSRRPTVDLAVAGAVEGIGALTVRINQVDTSCPANAATAYVSVIDQGGYPVRGLGIGNFTLTEGATPSPNLLVGATHIEAAYRPLAIAAVLDNSGSITTQPVAYADMKNGFATLFNRLRPNDVGELINFGTEYEVTVPFPAPVSTSTPTNKDALLAGLSRPWTKGGDTRLYDSVYRAIDDTALQAVYRRAIVVATDGVDESGGSGVPISTRTVQEIIAGALSRGVPIFTIGIGETVQAGVLEEMATRTGGVFFRASTSQNLATIYQQLSSLLFQDQYALAFNQLPLGAPGIAAPLRVDVVTPTGTRGNASGTIASCN